MIQNYLQYLSAVRGYSYNTVSSYERDIHAFVIWVRENKEDARWSNINRDDIDAYIIYNKNLGKKASTTNRQLSAISSLYRYFQRQGLEVENPCKYESRRKVADTIPNTIPYNSLKTAYQNARGCTRLMLGILCTTGIRIQEMLDLQWRDINFEENSLKINGKGSKERIVYTTEDVLAQAKEIGKYARPDMRLFYFNQRQARTTIWNALRPYCRAKQLSPHAIRHTVATHLACEGYNVASIAKLLGHSSIKTTQKYIDMTDVATKQAAAHLILTN